ncbi:shikimate kinase [Aureimonas fodinaquatilis]|uniref:Shikimate kinase n=1 Tax=Aureimonas fodinaquatilis TaxID=2565783 RepID=A0A5B0DXQ5_9HYPH|nr:shikimate kinase [Aureimonas fodinaquatilis]KAA0971607.1 shikimate kinase [Aureimonas fodinaquatilis]
MSVSAGKQKVGPSRPDLQGRSVALVGLMGAGKTTIGRKLAQVLQLPFVDSDAEIERISRMTISDLFAAYGEPEFRALEARVVARIAEDGPKVIGTGGGAYMNAATRQVLREHAVTIWLKADLDLLMDRVSKRPTRPLLQAPDPRQVMQDLIDKRYPVYAQADLVVQSRNAKRETIAMEIVAALEKYCAQKDSE